MCKAITLIIQVDTLIFITQYVIYYRKLWLKLNDNDPVCERVRGTTIAEAAKSVYGAFKTYYYIMVEN